MVEFVVVGPIITILGLAILQYCLMFFAKSQINHAGFMAARAGSVAHANIEAIKSAYVRALIPLYGGGRDTAEIAVAYAKASADLNSATLRIEIINPIKESFDDHATNASLNDKYQARAIPNAGIGLRPKADVESIGASSGQSLQDANLLKLRITHGYRPKVWLVGMLYQKYQQWMDTETDDFHTQLINSGHIPMVSHVTLEMQSDAVEQEDDGDRPVFASNPNQGNNGQPVNLGDPPSTTEPPPQCATMGCSVTYTPSDPGGGTDGNGGSGGGSGEGESSGEGGCTGANCPVCGG